MRDTGSKDSMRADYLLEKIYPVSSEFQYKCFANVEISRSLLR